MVALYIHLGRGTLEFHFGAFATLVLLMVCLDWRTIVALAAFFAVHRVLFDRLQAAGVGIYCTPEPNFLKIVMHAGHVVVQTSLEVFIAVTLEGSTAKASNRVPWSTLSDATGRSSSTGVMSP